VLRQLGTRQNSSISLLNATTEHIYGKLDKHIQRSKETLSSRQLDFWTGSTNDLSEVSSCDETESEKPISTLLKLANLPSDVNGSLKPDLTKVLEQNDMNCPVCKSALSNVLGILVRAN